ncbi:hypothetical protein Barb6_03821 [Bacteroidales bacterium Barb6]|nr:hypothetical protein Barb6_03821 [Bacteroidales bacterium Barb6]
MSQYVFQGIFIGSSFRTPQVGTDNQAAPAGQYLLQGRKSGTDTCVVRNVEILIQRDIKVHPHKCLFTGKVEIVNRLHTYLYL